MFIKMQSLKKQVVSLGILGSLLAVSAVDLSCARKPKDKISHGQNEFLYGKDQILGSKIEHLNASGSQAFSRKPFERLEGEWVEFDELNDVQKSLLVNVEKRIEEKLAANDKSRVKFVSNQEYIFVGVEGDEFFSYVWKVDGYYNFRDEKTKKGEVTGYKEKAQEGHWFDRPMISISSNTVAVPVKLADNEIRLTYARADLDNKTLTFSTAEAPKGFSKTAWNNVVSIYKGQIPDGAELISRIVNGNYRIYWVVKNSQGRKNEIEIARVSAELGYLDYSRDQNNAPSPDLKVTAGEGESNDYNFVTLSEITNPQVFATGALSLKDDYASARVLKDIPNLEIQDKIKTAIGASDDQAIEVSFNDSYVFVKVQDTTFRFSIDSHSEFVGSAGVECKSCEALPAGTLQRQPLFIVDSSSYEVVTAEALSQRNALEDSLQKSDVLGREFLYYPVLVDSSTDDPFSGAGSTPEGYYYDYAQGFKVKFVFDKDFVSAVITKDERDPTLSDRAVLKFPIREHYNLRYDATSKKYVRDTTVDWKVAQYVDVDFSRSAVPNFFDGITELNSFLGVYTGEVTEILEEPLNKNVATPNKYLYLDKSAGKPRYLSYLTRITATPNPYFVGANARPVNLKVRHGFLEMTNDSGFKPVIVDRFDYTTFGIFYQTKYNSKNGLLEENEEDYERMASIFNVAPEKGKIVTYYLNKDFPADYCPQALAAVESWNNAFQQSFQDNRTYVTLAEASAEEAALPEMQRFKDKCVKPDGTKIIPSLREVGDLRVNMIVHFSKNMGNGLAGFGPHMASPDTGEVLSASSFMYEGAIRGSYSAAGYLYDYMNMTPEEYESKSLAWAGPVGTKRSALVASSPSIASSTDAASSLALGSSNDLGLDLKPIAANKAAQVIARPSIATREFNGKGMPTNDSLINYFADKLAIDARAQQNLGFVAKRRDVYARIISQVVSKDSSESSFEASQALLDQTMQRKMGVEYTRIAKLGNKASKHAHDRSCSYGMDSVGQNAKAYYDVMKAKNPNMTRKDFQEAYAKSYYYDVLVHEMGHNFGLYHNFKASADRRNYPNLYHDLEARKASASSSQLALIEAQQRNIRTSSVMDYNPHYQGILKDTVPGVDGELNKAAVGPWDTAAIMYMYKGELEALPSSTASQDPDAPAYKQYTARIPRSVFRETLANIVAGDNSPYRPVYNARQALNIRNYSYCTNGDQDSDPLCAVFDSGSTPQEIVQEAVEAYETGYALGAVNHGAIDFSPYRNGLGSTSPYDRGLSSRIRAMFDLYADYTGYGVGLDYVVRPDDGFKIQDYRDAAKIGVDYLNNTIISSLDDVEYLPSYDLQTGAYEYIQLTSPIKTAKNLYAKWQYENFIGDARPVKRGIIYDVMDAMEALVIRQSISRLDSTNPYSQGWNVVSDPYFAKDLAGTLGYFMQTQVPIEVKATKIRDGVPGESLAEYAIDNSQPAANRLVIKELPKFLGEIGIIYGAAFYNSYPDRRAFSALTRFNVSCDKTSERPFGPQAITAVHPSSEGCTYTFPGDGKLSLLENNINGGLLSDVTSYSKLYHERRAYVEAPAHTAPYLAEIATRQISESDKDKLEKAIALTMATGLGEENITNFFRAVVAQTAGADGKLDTLEEITVVLETLKTQGLLNEDTGFSVLDIFAGNLETLIANGLKEAFNTGSQDVLQQIVGLYRDSAVYVVQEAAWDGQSSPALRYAKLAKAVKDFQSVAAAGPATLSFYNVTVAIPAELSPETPVEGETASAARSVTYPIKDLLGAGEIALSMTDTPAKVTDENNNYFDAETFERISKLAIEAFGKIDLIRHYDNVFNGVSN